MEIEQPNNEDSTIREEIKDELMESFNKITLEVGRQMLKDSNVLILSK